MFPDFTGLHSLYYLVHLQNLQHGVCREVRALIKLLMNLTIRDVVDFGGDSDQPGGQVNIAQVSQKSLFIYTWICTCGTVLFRIHPKPCTYGT